MSDAEMLRRLVERSKTAEKYVKGVAYMNILQLLSLSYVAIGIVVRWWETTS